MSQDPTPPLTPSWWNRLLGRPAVAPGPHPDSQPLTGALANAPAMTDREARAAFAAARQQNNGQGAPLPLRLRPGVYYYCTCGRSARMPFCDGKHRGTEHSPRSLVVENQQTYAATLCACGQQQLGSAPLCHCNNNT